MRPSASSRRTSRASRRSARTASETPPGTERRSPRVSSRGFSTSTSPTTSPFSSHSSSSPRTTPSTAAVAQIHSTAFRSAVGSAGFSPSTRRSASTNSPGTSRARSTSTTDRSSAGRACRSSTSRMNLGISDDAASHVPGDAGSSTIARRFRAKSAAMVPNVLRPTSARASSPGLSHRSNATSAPLASIRGSSPSLSV